MATQMTLNFCRQIASIENIERYFSVGIYCFKLFKFDWMCYTVIVIFASTSSVPNQYSSSITHAVQFRAITAFGIQNTAEVKFKNEFFFIIDNEYSFLMLIIHNLPVFSLSSSSASTDSWSSDCPMRQTLGIGPVLPVTFCNWRTNVSYFFAVNNNSYEFVFITRAQDS